MRIGIIIARVKFLTIAIAALFVGLVLSSFLSMSSAQSPDAQRARRGQTPSTPILIRDNTDLPGLEEGSVTAPREQVATVVCGLGSWLLEIIVGFCLAVGCGFVSCIALPVSFLVIIVLGIADLVVNLCGSCIEWFWFLPYSPFACSVATTPLGLLICSGLAQIVRGLIGAINILPCSGALAGLGSAAVGCILELVTFVCALLWDLFYGFALVAEGMILWIPYLIITLLTIISYLIQGCGCGPFLIAGACPPFMGISNLVIFVLLFALLALVAVPFCLAIFGVGLMLGPLNLLITAVCAVFGIFTTVLGVGIGSCLFVILGAAAGTCWGCTLIYELFAVGSCAGTGLCGGNTLFASLLSIVADFNLFIAALGCCYTSTGIGAPAGIPMVIYGLCGALCFGIPAVFDWLLNFICAMPVWNVFGLIVFLLLTGIIGLIMVGGIYLLLVVGIYLIISAIALCLFFLWYTIPAACCTIGLCPLGWASCSAISALPSLPPLIAGVIIDLLTWLGIIGLVICAIIAVICCCAVVVCAILVVVVIPALVVVGVLLYLLSIAMSYVMRFLSFASKILVRVMEPVYQNIYIFLDLIVTSFGYCTDLFSVLVNVWGVISSEIKICTTLLNLCTSLCSTMPFIAAVPSVLMTLCWDIPLAFCGILQSYGFLCLTLSSMLIDAISRIRDWFPAPGEAL